MKLLSDSQYIILTSTIIFSATLSVAGSAMIIFMARRKIMGCMYQRLVSILSFADIVFSLSSVMQTFLKPEESGDPWAIGSHTSCTVTGFLFTWGVLFSPLYNCILSVYFSLRVRNHWREKELIWRFEIPSHVIGTTVPLILPIAALSTNSLAFISTLEICAYGGYPIGCLLDDDMECQRGEFSRYFFLPNACIILLICIIGTTSTFLVYWRVRWQLTRKVRYAFGQTTTMDEESARALGELRTQAVLYGLIFFNNVMWPVLSVAVFYANPSISIKAAGESHFFAFLFFNYLLYPLQGALNFLVYIKPEHAQWKIALPDYSSSKIIKSMIAGENIDEHVQKRENDTVPISHETFVTKSPDEEHTDSSGNTRCLQKMTNEEKSFCTNTNPVERKTIGCIPKKVRSNREIVLAACIEDGMAIKRASQKLRRDKEIVLAACVNHGSAIKCTSKKLRNDKEVVLTACKENGASLQYASNILQHDKDVVLAACTTSGGALQWAPRELQNDKRVVLAACNQDGHALEWASSELRNDKEVVLCACCNNAGALQHASRELRSDKEVVIAAASCQPESLKYALGGLNQDPDCLIAAKIWVSDREHGARPDSDKIIKIVLSTRFSLGEDCSSNATQFTVELLKHPYILQGKNGKKFDVYSPNAVAKGTCDPKWTRLKWPCRGTYETCRKEGPLKVGIPQPNSCWRYSFRYQQQLALLTKGFMIQVVDFDSLNGHELGNGQVIETEMANAIGLKIFRIHQPATEPTSEPNESGHDYIPFQFKRSIPFQFQTSHIDKLITSIETWYSRNCEDRSICEIHLQ